MARQDAHLTEREELALRVLALVEETTVAEQRRLAVRAHARAALDNPHLAECVDLALAAQRGRSNVVRFPERRSRA